MNILLVNDDGPGTMGLDLLRDAVKRHWKDSNVTAIIPKTDQSGVGMGTKVAPEKVRPQKQAPGLYVVPSATPADIIHHAFLKTNLYLPGDQRFDLVISGVNHGSNVGMSIFASGTVGAVLLAANHYGACGWAFSQSFGTPGERGLKPKGAKEIRRAFQNTRVYLPKFFESQKPMPGECWNVNFPEVDVTKGWIQCHVSPFDPYVGSSFTPLQALKAPGDVELLSQGYITRSPVVLGYNPPLAW